MREIEVQVVIPRVVRQEGFAARTISEGYARRPDVQIISQYVPKHTVGNDKPRAIPDMPE
jgi:hypothetical protein